MISIPDQLKAYFTDSRASAAAIRAEKDASFQIASHAKRKAAGKKKKVLTRRAK